MLLLWWRYTTGTVGGQLQLGILSDLEFRWCWLCGGGGGGQVPVSVLALCWQ